MDRQWWDVHLDEVNRVFRGTRYSTNPLPERFLTTNLSLQDFPAYGNSGAACITLAAQAGASRIILLGFDCKKTGGKTHWHGDHPRKLDNAKYINRWPEKFAEQAKTLKHINIINCSRETALTCYPRMNLEEALC